MLGLLSRIRWSRSRRVGPEPRLTRRSRAGVGMWLTLLGLLALSCDGRLSGSGVALTTSSGEACLDGSVACGDSCALLASSAQNCGACGSVCSSTDICDRGRCRPAAAGCSEPTLLCGSDCINAQTDEQHCGGCNDSCPSTASCTGGACECPGAASVCGNDCV